MRKEMFIHEINILRDTYRRLLSRQAKTNLIKLTRKTHPADLATVYRHFTDEEQVQIFTLMNENEHTAEFLSELASYNLLEFDTPPSFSIIFLANSSGE